MISVLFMGGILVGILVFVNRGIVDFYLGFDSFDVGIEFMYNICDIIMLLLF